MAAARTTAAARMTAGCPCNACRLSTVPLAHTTRPNPHLIAPMAPPECNKEAMASPRAEPHDASAGASPAPPHTPQPAAPCRVRLHTTTSSSSAVVQDDTPSSPTASVFAGRTVLILSGGTRGDVQPATALGVALLAAGAQHVRLACDASCRDLVLAAGLEWFPLGGDAKGVMALTVKWGGMLPTEFAGMAWLRGQIADVMESVVQAATLSAPDGDAATSSSTPGAAAAFRPDLILANQLAFGQVHMAEALGVPLHILLTIPWLPTTEIAHPWARAWDHNIAGATVAAAAWLLRPVVAAVRLFSPRRAGALRDAVLARVEAAANWTTTPLLDVTAWWGIPDLHVRLRRKLVLPLLLPNMTGMALYTYPTTCLFSPLLVPKPQDWGPHVTLAGFLSLPRALDRRLASSSSSGGSDGDVEDSTSVSYQPPQALQAFLAAGPPPVYIGFGSMVVQDPQVFLQLVLTAVSLLQDSCCDERVRVLLCTGWAGCEGIVATASAGSTQSDASSSTSSDVFCIPEVPHDWLFPRCRALVHHGGVGTTAAGLTAGKPTLVVAAFGDLFFWGDVCHRLGVGPAPLSLKGLTAGQLAAAMQELLAEQPSFSAAAQTVAAGLQQQEDAALDATLASVAATLQAGGGAS